MPSKIVQLQDKDGNAVFPVAGGIAPSSVTTSAIADGAITNDKLNLSYSTSEHATGETWVDGRPIYRKAYVGTYSRSASAVNNITLESSKDVTLINVGGAMEHSSPGWVPVSYAEGDTEYAYIYVQNTSHNLLLRNKGTAATNLRYRVWVEYVKNS